MATDDLTIPHPIQLESMRGALSLGQCGRPLAVRLHDDDIAALYDIAKHLGIRPGAVMRWAIVYTVRALHEQHFNTKIEVRA